MRAGLLKRAQDWRWSSAAPVREEFPVLTPGPVPHLLDWLGYVNEAQTEAEVESLGECTRRRRPYGNELWTPKTARKMDLQASLRPRGRPPKKKTAQPAPLFGAADHK